MSDDKKQSSMLLNLFMMGIGLFFLSKGVLELLTWWRVAPLPDWLATAYRGLSDNDLANVSSLLGTTAIISTTLGFWALIAGLLMFREQESGWGMALVILSTIALMGIATIIRWIGNPSSFSLTYWPTWVTMITVLFGFLGFFYLLFTGKRYG